LRQCELRGIEASAEIQQAARKVADENRRLRILLRCNGVSDDSVETFLFNSSNHDSMGAESGFGGQGGSQAVQSMEQLLNTRRQLPADTGAPSLSIARDGSRDSSVASMSTLQSRWDQPTNSGYGAMKQPYLTPSSSIGRNSTSREPQTHNRPPPGTQHTNSSSNSTIPQQQLNPASNSYEFDSQLSSMLQSHSYNSQQTFQAQPQNPPPPVVARDFSQGHATSDSSIAHSNSSQCVSTSTAIPTSGAVGTNGCQFATEMISTMTGSDPSSVRAALGCAPYQGQDCEVDNQTVFSVLDQYTGQGIGL
jgi:hypothetical protein